VYKLARLNWCCQLLNSYLALMVDFIWFADGKLLKFYRCSHRVAQNIPFYAFVGTAWLLLLIAASSKTMHQHTEIARWLSF